MIRRAFGSTGHILSVVGWGGFAAGGFMWGGQDDADTVAAIHAAVDGGVNWLDTAPLYGSGKADAAVARAVAELPASRRPLIATKFGHHVVDGQRITDNSPARVVADCETALRTFAIDAIDLFQMHWPVATGIAETAAAVAALVAAGKVKAVGLCNVDVPYLEAWIAAGGPLHAVQNRCSVFHQADVETVIPWCAGHGVAYVAYSPLERGLLFGGWTPEQTFAAGDHRSERPDFRGKRLARRIAAAQAIAAIAAEDDETCAGLAIGALLCIDGLTACLVGARNAAQGAFLGQLGRPAKASQVAAIDAIAAELDRDLAAIGAG